MHREGLSRKRRSDKTRGMYTVLQSLFHRTKINMTDHAIERQSTGLLPTLVVTLTFG